MDKEMLYLIGQVISVVTFAIALRYKIDALTESIDETKEIVVEIRKEVIELSQDKARKDEKIKHIERIIFGPKERKDS